MTYEEDSLWIHEGYFKAQLASSSISNVSCRHGLAAAPISRTEIGLWNLHNLGEGAHKCQGHHTTGVTALSFGHQVNPLLLATGSTDAVNVWITNRSPSNYRTGVTTTARKVAKNLGHVQDICFSYDDKLLSLAIEKEIWIIEIKNCKHIVTLEGHNGDVTKSQFCPHDETLLVTISDDRVFMVWNVKSKSLLYKSSIISGSPFLAIDMHPVYKHFTVGSGDGKLRVYDLTTHREVHSIDIASKWHQNRNIQPSQSSVTFTDVRHVSSRPQWQQAHSISQTNIDSNSSVAIPECVIISLMYWYDDTPTSDDNNSLPYFLQNDATGQRTTPEDAILLFVGCTSTIIILDGNSLELLIKLDLDHVLLNQNHLDPVEHLLTAAGSISFCCEDDPSRVYCLVGTMFQSETHLLSMDVTKVVFITSEDRIKSTEFSLDAATDEISILSSFPLLETSPLRSTFQLKTPQKNGAHSKTSSQLSLDSPLTFNSRIASSGYTEAPRMRMFKPVTRGGKPLPPSRKPQDLQNISMKSYIGKQYPMQSSAPTVKVKQHNLANNASTTVNNVHFSPDGKHLACSLGDNHSIILKIPFTGKHFSLAGHNGSVNSTSFAYNSDYLLTSSADKTVRLWIPGSKDSIMTFNNIKHNLTAEKVKPNPSSRNPVFKKPITKAMFYYLDRFVLMSCGDTMYLYKYNVDKVKKDVKRYITNNKYKLVEDFQMSNVQNITHFSSVNGFYSYIVLCALSNKNISVVDMNHGEVVRTMNNVHSRNVHHICQNEGSPFASHSPDAYDLFLTSAAGDGMKLWDLRMNRCVRRFDGHVNRSHRVRSAFSTCSRFIATGSEDRSAYVYDIRNNSYLHRLSGHTDVVTSVTFHPQIPMLCTGTLDGKVNFFVDAM